MPGQLPPKIRSRRRRLRSDALERARNEAPSDLDELLRASSGDGRTVAAAKRAARWLLARDEPVTRSSFVRAARTSGIHAAMPGLAESTLDSNPAVRVIFERVCSRPRGPARRKRDGVTMHVARSSRSDLLQRLENLDEGCTRQIARIEQADRRLPAPPDAADQASLDAALAHMKDAVAFLGRREQPSCLLAASAGRSRSSEERVRAAVAAAVRGGGPLTDGALAAAAAVSVSTILRNPGARAAVLAARAKRSGRTPARPPVPDPYPGRDKRTLVRAIQCRSQALEMLRAIANRRTILLVDHDDAGLREQARLEAERIRSDVAWQSVAFPED